MTPYPERRFRFWRGWLLVATAIFAVQALSWVFIGSFDPFGIYDGLLARALYGTDTLPADAALLFRFAVVPLGATTAGYFVLAHAIVRFAFPRRERWAWWAVTGAIAVWFVFDSAFSIWHGAAFNVFLVNIPCVVILGVPLGALWPAFQHSANQPRATETAKEEQS